MTKNDLNLIAAFVDVNNPKVELNFAYLGKDGIYATDTRKMIFFPIPMLDSDLFLHKKLLKGFASTVSKDEDISIDGLGYIRSMSCKMSCDTWNYSTQPKNIDYDKILNIELSHKFTLESINDLQFELSQRNCFIDSVHLDPIIENSECSKYHIQYEQQKEITDENGTSTKSGMLKITGLYSTEDEKDLVRFAAIVHGRTFKTEAKQDLL